MEEPTVNSYSPNDFMYMAVDTTTNPISCPSSADDLSKAYCQNVEHAQMIASAQASHSGAQERYIDTKNNYNMQLLTSFNLGIGIIGIGVFIFYNH